jgi:adenylate cyclase
VTAWWLEGITLPQRIELPPDATLLVGRAPECQIIISDVTVSRRHAALALTGGRIMVRDLGSSNGTLVNGARIVESELAAGDIVTFGKVSYRAAASASLLGTGDVPAAGTVVRPVNLGAGVDELAEAPALRENLQAHRLAHLVDLAKRLSGEYDVERLLASVVELTFDLLAVDRVSLLLLNEATGDLIPTLSKSRFGETPGMRVPRSIAGRAVHDLTPIITENAAADERFNSGSVQLQSVRGAICTPLLASKERVLGALYVDTLTASRPFSEDDATLLFAFAGLAAAAISKARLAEEVALESQVRANFERFFAPGVAARIAKQRGSIDVGGERVAATVLFSDIRHFTALAERMRPEEISTLLTAYFSEMVDIVFEHGGTLDKFIGDSLLAVWGAPLATPGDADRALAAAFAMQRRLETLNPLWERAGQPRLSIGIGLNYGDVFAGYLGSDRRLEYTVLGDTVNVASRLCGNAAGGEILLTQSVVSQLATRPSIEAVPEIRLKGKQQAVAVYRIVGDPTEPHDGAS